MDVILLFYRGRAPRRFYGSECLFFFFFFVLGGLPRILWLYLRGRCRFLSACHLSCSLSFFLFQFLLFGCFLFCTGSVCRKSEIDCAGCRPARLSYPSLLIIPRLSYLLASTRHARG